MQHRINAQPKDLKKLNLKGIEVVHFTSGSNDTDFKMIEFRDTITGESLNIAMSPYSDFRVSVVKPKEMVEKYRLVGTVYGVKVDFVADTEKECLGKAEEIACLDAKIEKTQVEKVD